MKVKDFKSKFLVLSKVQREETIKKMEADYEDRKSDLNEEQLIAFVKLVEWCKDNING